MLPILTKAKLMHILDTAIPLLGINSIEIFKYIEMFKPQETCTRMFIMALLIISPNWKLPNSLTTLD